MVGERQTRWKSLLRHIKGNAPAKPPKAWLKEAEKRLIAVGQEEFIRAGSLVRAVPQRHAATDERGRQPRFAWYFVVRLAGR